ncbi:MAG TPA: prolyl oligopeptidase family serine peptidase [Polyangiaceae bacterium]|nr:prolyl oligopeptidase family serine peptidase [Polyangiaceae bacterium]
MRCISILPALALLPLLTSCASGDPALEPKGPTATAAPTTPPRTAAAEAPDPAAAKGYPATPKRPVTDAYHGVKVTDDYRWLEQGSQPEVKQWVAAQNTKTRAYFDELAVRKPIQARVKEIISAMSPHHFALKVEGGQLFAMKWQPPKQQPFLVTMKPSADLKSERALVDPSTLDPEGRTSIAWYVPSHDGKKVAVTLARAGTEDGTVHVYDVATGKPTGDVVPYANSGTALGSLAWNSDGTGFYYTRHPHPGEVPPEDMGAYQKIYFHKLGTKNEGDQFSFGKDFPRIAEVDLEASEDGKFIHAAVQNGDGREFWHYMLGPSGKWVEIATLADKITQAAFGADNKLYMLSVKGSPRGKLLRIDPAKPDLATAEVAIPEGSAAIQRFVATKSRIYATYVVGGPHEARVFDLKGKPVATLPTLPVSSVHGMVRLEGDDILFSNVSFIDPPAWYRYAAKGGKAEKTSLATKATASFEGVEVVRETCTSKDGTKVPISIMRRKGTKLDGQSPALLTGYGGYGISISPGFDEVDSILLENGFVQAVANIRGGGEFGDEWHRAGNLTKKQNVFDDFAGCAKHLIEAGYTKPERLAIVGGSNGGLLMGASLTQHPELFKAVVSFVGIYDSLRVELTPNGAFNVTEFGTVKDPEQFKALHAYSPYHHVKDGTAYPAVLLLTGENDPRVDPYHSRKMAARLQAATSSSAPILLRSNSNAGHGGDTPLSEKVEEVSDFFSFVFAQLGVEYKPIPAAPKPVAGAQAGDSSKKPGGASPN